MVQAYSITSSAGDAQGPWWAAPSITHTHTHTHTPYLCQDGRVAWLPGSLLEVFVRAQSVMAYTGSQPLAV